jgi:uncharacterized membrane protein YphA (DoxX/SURF4 family)
VFTPVTHGDHIAFFEIAATLIPILLFGGVVADRLRPKTYEPLSRIANYAFRIPAFGTFAILAEVTAIVAVVSGRSAWWSRLIVAAFLTVGMLAIIISLWLPWIEELRRRDSRKAHSAVRGSVVLLLLAFAGSVWVITTGVSGEAELARVDAYLKAQQLNNVARTAALNRGTSLVAASGRVQQQRIAAESRNEDPKVIAALRGQEETLLKLAIGSVEWLDRLELEAANLYREMVRAPRLQELPRKKPIDKELSTK